MISEAAIDDCVSNWLPNAGKKPQLKARKKTQLHKRLTEEADVVY